MKKKKLERFDALPTQSIPQDFKKKREPLDFYSWDLVTTWKRTNEKNNQGRDDESSLFWSVGQSRAADSRCFDLDAILAPHNYFTRFSRSKFVSFQFNRREYHSHRVERYAKGTLSLSLSSAVSKGVRAPSEFFVSSRTNEHVNKKKKKIREERENISAHAFQFSRSSSATVVVSTVQVLLDLPPPSQPPCLVSLPLLWYFQHLEKFNFLVSSCRIK